MRFRAVLAFVATLGVAVASAQEPLSINRIFSDEFDPEPTAIADQWLPDGQHMLSVKDRQVVTTDMRTGKVAILAKAAELKGFVPESATLNGSKLLLFGNSKKVWRLNTRGDYAVFDLKSRKLRRLGPSGVHSELMFAKLSPNGDKVGYVFRNNLYVVTLADGHTTPLTKDGTELLINGTFDWVYEEELGLRDGWRWSPDGKSVAFWQIDARKEPMFTLVDQSRKDQAFKTFPYPKAGGPNAFARIGVVPARGGTVRWMKLVATPWDGYLARMEWVPNSQKLLVQKLNRRQNQNGYYLVDTKTSNSKLVWTESDATWVDVNDTSPTGVAWTDGGRRFITFSERSGQRSLYVVGLDGAMKNLTPGNLDVDAEGVQIIGQEAYFYASPKDAAQRYLYRTSLKTLKPEPVAPNAPAGFHRYQVAPKGDLAIHEFSKLGQPPTTEVVNLSTNQTTRELSSNAALSQKLAGVQKGRIERRVFLAADGKTAMDGLVVYPPDFDPSKRYPVLFDVYGGPAAATVFDQWLGVQQLFWWFLAQRGYIVATVDNRGTPALKGRAWRKSIYLHMNPIVAVDQAAAGRQMASLPFVDPKRVGIWGWSTGGSNTLQALFSYPDVWSLGMAVAPMSDIALYDTIYTERYSGLPSEQARAYHDDSPINFAQGLRGDLLIAYGTGDDNCHAQANEWLIDRLVSLGKRFTVMPYPNRTHEINEGKGTIEHLFETLCAFLDAHMPGGPRP